MLNECNYSTLSPIHPGAKVVMPMSKSKGDLAQIQIHDANIILILRPKVKVIQRSRMYVTHYPMVKHSCARYGITVNRQKSCGPNTKPCQKLYKFDLEFKGQHHIRIMNKRNTFSHGDKPMCYIWYSNVKENRS